MTSLDTAPASRRAVTRRPNKTLAPAAARPLMALTRKVKAAIDAQVFVGMRRKEAAEHAGLTEQALYVALRKPVVLAYWNDCLQVLRSGERARNVQRLAEIREQNDNLNAAVASIKQLELDADTKRDAAGQRVVTPGVVVVVNAARPDTYTDNETIEINPGEVRAGDE